ncbi:MAG: hypothetical protein A2840_00105 [Candidatus Buchananbacteria bacterium RIFCSPHIGHO2_01_FULL_47_11b]|uniref:cysteine desulfurase n=1 Tax=Candidatus Buchananbacteria bacterium RIFCSPHIGHO2_01_FULL_47_11b TaxID=1797537 RepID=A0A1G1Y662_9BACT|nr:MAG: hypothetical protein A2840_00105 [Candidatus Buchananbacteria bacterium RIFCSPHIGHO2_01_FULL_47_11b]
MKKIYLDYAATTPVDPTVAKVLQPFFVADFGNPGSVHQFGRVALAAVDRARAQVAQLLGSTPHEIIFTSGATESANVAIRGTLYSGDHCVTTTIEHPAVLGPIAELAKQKITATTVGVLKSGIVDANQIIAAIKPETKLISMMYVNNEVGTIQPVAQVAQQLRSINVSRQKEGLKKVLLHTDATQALFYLPCDVTTLGVDLLTISSHKVYGPKGAGALYVKNGVGLEPLIVGGPQEYGLRAGTQNVPAIVGFGHAASLLAGPKHQKELTRIGQLRDWLLAAVQKNFPTATVNGELQQRVAGNLNITLPGIDGQQLLILLDKQGIAVSTGAACASGSPEPSHVLLAMGYSQAAARSSIRISVGKTTKKKELVRFIYGLRQAVKILV